ncbi:MAG: hypothetical protein ABI361_14205 [Nitrososphaera sp.]|jgi:hypothetical protein
MAKSKAKSDLVLRLNTTSTKITEVGQQGIMSEMTSRGSITGKYRGTHWDTVQVRTKTDGTSEWSVKFIQMTNKGMVYGSGQGTGDSPNAKGVARMRGEGQIWTSSPKLSDLNGANWTCEVDNNLMTDRAIVAVNFR